MNREDQVKFCKICQNRSFSMDKGVICSLTNEPATFVDECPDFKLDDVAAQEELAREKKQAEVDLEEETGGLSSFGIKDGRTAGIFMIVGAIVWFFAGIMFLNRIFFYPFFLVIAGIAVWVKAKK